MEDCWHWSKEVITGTKSRWRKVSMWKCEWERLFWLANVALSARWEPQPLVMSRVWGGEKGTGLCVKVSNRQNKLHILNLRESVSPGLNMGFLQQVAFPPSTTAMFVHVWHTPARLLFSQDPHPNAPGEISWANRLASHLPTLICYHTVE